jgi:hypothetical protein
MKTYHFKELNMKGNLDKINKSGSEIVKFLNKSNMNWTDAIPTILKGSVRNMYINGYEFHEIQYEIMELIHDQLQEINEIENGRCKNTKELNMRENLDKIDKLNLEIEKIFNDNNISFMDGIRTILRIAAINRYKVGSELHEIHYEIMKLVHEEIQEIQEISREICQDWKNTKE